MGDFQNELIDKILSFDSFIDQQKELGHILGKSSLASHRFRTKGNELYIKKNHTEDDHKQILLLYTSSISYAPNNSEELAKAYSNRSALLMHLHRYEECLVDIDRALQISQSDALRAKLESRKQDCLKLNKNKPARILSEELPNIQSSSKLLSAASEAVDVKYNDTFGRHLVATRDIKPGEILILEKGYAFFPGKDQIHITCSHCMAFAWNGIPCDTCVFAIFCSEECKNEAWQEYHDVECSIISFIFFDKNACITTVMLTIRLFIKAVKNEGFDNVISETKIANKRKIDNIEALLTNGMLVSNMFRSYYNLLTHERDIAQDFHDSFYGTMIVILLLKHTSIIPVDIKLNERSKIVDELELLTLLLNIFAKLRNLVDVNSYDCQGVYRGSSVKNTYEALDRISARNSIIASTCSLVNHSCCPNISRMFFPKRKICMYTIAPIKKGQQLFDSYGPKFWNAKEERQKYLKKHFHFTCKCIACEENWPPSVDMELFKNPLACIEIQAKVIREFEKYYPDEENVLIKIMNKFIDQQFDKSTLEKNIRFLELIYKHFDYREAFYRSINFSMYIEWSFFHFYGEKCDALKGC